MNARKLLCYIFRLKFGQKWFVPDIVKVEKILAKEIPEDH